MVTVERPDGAVERRYEFGSVVTKIEADPSHARTVAVRSLGVTRSLEGTTAGWYSADLALLPPECHIVLWTHDDAQLAALSKFLRDHDDACTTTGAIEGK